MDNLLELVKTAEPNTDTYDKGEKVLGYAEELDNLGFKQFADRLRSDASRLDKLDRITKLGYLKIREEKIHEFLKKKVELYNKKQSQPIKKVGRTLGELFSVPPARFTSPAYDPEMYAAMIAREQLRTRPLPLDHITEDLRVRQDNHIHAIVVENVRTHRSMVFTPEEFRRRQEMPRGFRELETPQPTRPHTGGYIAPGDTFTITTTTANTDINAGMLPNGSMIYFDGSNDIQPTRTGLEDHSDKAQTRWVYAYPTMHSASTDPKLTGKYVWEEVRIEKTDVLPPKEVIAKLKKAITDKVFDFFTIARVKGVPDPLLLGRLEGVTDRWFIAQYDSDVHVEDLL